MINHESTATPEQKKKLWFEGANYTADAIVINALAQHILLIKRSDTGQWALPGGFVDPGESTLEAARREAYEEAGITLTGGELVFNGVVNDPRNTHDAWIETSAYLFKTDSNLKIKAGDDANEAEWKEIAQLPTLYASHAHIIEQALPHIASA